MRDFQGMPELPLPPMPEAARAVLRRIIEHEKPYGYRSMDDILGLAHARGWSAHPEDWMPIPGEAFHPDFYQPWVDWMAETGLTPYGGGNHLTDENWDRWKPAARRDAFERLLNKDRGAARAMLLERGRELSSRERKWFLQALRGGVYFYGIMGADAWTVQAFTMDRNADIAALAREMLHELDGRITMADDARELATRFEMRDGRCTIISDKVAIRDPSCYRLIRSVTLEAFAEALSISPVELVRVWDADMQSTHSLPLEFMGLVRACDDPEVQEAHTTRMIDEGRCLPRLLDDDERYRLLRERCMTATWSGAYIGGLIDDYGSLPMDMVRIMPTYDGVRETVAEGKVPPNEMWGPLRTLGYLIDREAAVTVRDEAIAFGMSEDDPRLDMLHFNIALEGKTP